MDQYDVLVFFFGGGEVYFRSHWNTGTILVYQYCLKMCYLRSLERASVIQKLTILERKAGLVLSNTCVPIPGTWSILFPFFVLLWFFLFCFVFVFVFGFFYWLNHCLLLQWICFSFCESMLMICSLPSLPNFYHWHCCKGFFFLIMRWI